MWPIVLEVVRQVMCPAIRQTADRTTGQTAGEIPRQIVVRTTQPAASETTPRTKDLTPFQTAPRVVPGLPGVRGSVFSAGDVLEFL